MISVKKYAEVKIEITLHVLIGELKTVERDLSRLKLAKFLEVWEPEIVDSDLWLRLRPLDERREEQLSTKGKRVRKRKAKEVTSEDEGTDPPETGGAERCVRDESSEGETSQREM